MVGARSLSIIIKKMPMHTGSFGFGVVGAQLPSARSVSYLRGRRAGFLGGLWGVPKQSADACANAGRERAGRGGAERSA